MNICQIMNMGDIGERPAESARRLKPQATITKPPFGGWVWVALVFIILVVCMYSLGQVKAREHGPGQVRLPRTARSQKSEVRSQRSGFAALPCFALGVGSC